jgi:UDP-N-acetylglucosamine 2-epimerase (non-hydrolysing)
MRRITERPEGIEAGTAKLIGIGVEAIVENVNWLLKDSTEYARMATARNPYGDGMAAGRIVEVLKNAD